MSTLVKLRSRGQITIPREIRSALGLADGDLMEIKTVGRKIVLTPQRPVDYSKFPNADDEYTPEQRKIIDASLDEAQKGPYYGPFKNGKEVEAFLKVWIRTDGQPPAKYRVP
jgi:AbrB family looped-hinge helix DNA binding protein